MCTPTACARSSARARGRRGAARRGLRAPLREVDVLVAEDGDRRQRVLGRRRRRVHAVRVAPRLGAVHHLPRRRRRRRRRRRPRPPAVLSTADSHGQRAKKAPALLKSARATVQCNTLYADRVYVLETRICLPCPASRRVVTEDAPGSWRRLG